MTEVSADTWHEHHVRISPKCGTSVQRLDELHQAIVNLRAKGHGAATREEAEYWYWLADAAAADYHFATRPEGAWKMELVGWLAIFALPIGVFLWVVFTS